LGGIGKAIEIREAHLSHARNHGGQMFGFRAAEVSDAKKNEAIKTLLGRLSDGSQPVDDQLKQVNHNIKLNIAYAPLAYI
jgi:hypothetical protein